MIFSCFASLLSRTWCCVAILRERELAGPPYGQQVAWHYHTNIQDTFYVLDGSVRITLRDPDEQVDLQPGESWRPVRPGRPHLVTNSGGGSATFLVLQGMGDWDHIPLP